MDERSFEEKRQAFYDQVSEIAAARFGGKPFEDLSPEEISDFVRSEDFQAVAQEGAEVTQYVYAELGAKVVQKILGLSPRFRAELYGRVRDLAQNVGFLLGLGNVEDEDYLAVILMSVLQSGDGDDDQDEPDPVDEPEGDMVEA